MGAWCCDDAFELDPSFTCEVLENNYNWDCTGCSCPGDVAADDGGSDAAGSDDGGTDECTDTDNGATDPYGDGWLIKIKPTNVNETDHLMNFSAYEEFVI